MQPTDSLLPLLSVIVVNDNKPEGLQVTLDNLLGQTYPNLEYLVVSIGEDAKKSLVLEANALRIKHILIESRKYDLSIIDSIIPHCEGEFVLVVKSGNVLCENNVISTLLESAKDFDLVYGNVIKVFPNRAQQNEVFSYPAELTLNGVLYSMPDVLTASIIRRAFLETNKLYDDRVSFAIEWAFLLRSFLSGRLRSKRIDIDVTFMNVGRHGGTDKLSNIQLIAKEKESFINEYLQSPATDIKATKAEGKKDFLKDELGLPKLIANTKRQYRSLRSKIELISYKKNFKESCFNIPIIINNRNHLTYLKRLIASLEKRGYKNIFILDNDSDYPPLIDFYKETNHKVFSLNDNVGFCALWDTDVFDFFKDQYYVYTDSDLELVEECPDDFLVVLHYLLNKYSLGKVGLSLVTSDLPTHFENRLQVQEWESRFQKDQVERLAYNAMVDTTFALYRPNSFGDAGMLKAFRARFPYSAHHLPWYENTSSLTDEQLYYYKNAKTSSHWTKMIKEKE